MVFCGTNLIVSNVWHEFYCSLPLPTQSTSPFLAYASSSPPTPPCALFFGLYLLIQPASQSRAEFSGARSVRLESSHKPLASEAWTRIAECRYGHPYPVGPSLKASISLQVCKSFFVCKVTTVVAVLCSAFRLHLQKDGGTFRVFAELCRGRLL